MFATATLTAHRGATIVNREELAKYEPPEPEGGWKPVKHSLIVDFMHEVSSTPFFVIVFDNSFLPLGKYRRRHFDCGVNPCVIVVRDRLCNLVHQLS
jgi:hypothetical protein